MQPFLSPEARYQAMLRRSAQRSLGNKNLPEDLAPEEKTQLELKGLKEEEGVAEQNKSAHERIFEMLDLGNKSIKQEEARKSRINVPELSGGGGFGAAPTGGGRGVPPSGPLPQDEAAAKAWIIQRESGGKTTIKNKDSSAFGLGQLIEKNRIAYGKKLGVDPWTTDYNAQSQMMDMYVKDRYGSYQNAVNFWRKNNWY